MQVGWEGLEGRGAPFPLMSLSLFFDEKTMKSRYILYNFCVFVQNHISKPI